MKYSLTLLSLSMASAMATPFASSTPKCNIAPSASSNRKVQPYHTGKADTAIDCQTFCASDDHCKSFAFGLVKGHSHPSCLLFKVSASEVPTRKDGLHVFDKQCASDRVPTSAPTASEPWGTVPKKVLVRRSLKCNCAASGSASSDVEPFKTTTAATAKDCQALAEADSSCQSFLFGLPSGSSTPVCKLYKVAAAKVPAHADTLFVFDKGCSSKQVPTTPPTEDAPRGLVGTAKVTKVAEVKAEKQDNDAYNVSNPKPKATKIAKVEDDKTQYAQVGDDTVKHQAKVTKVVNKQPKATKVAKVDNQKVQKNQDKSGETEAKAAKVENKQPKATKIQNSKPQATKVQYKDETKNTSDKDNTNENKNVKADSPKTLATKVRNNEHQATKVQAVEHQATQAEGRKSACKTTKGSAAQPKITQA
ncbi:hypothetical protein FBULB1_1471 [Fusarium bulbicola]|nr:hypothetical protein FBULB1_1471 [Fusarium bulbicola]